jgi:Flp pilus assembly protein CpaB
MPWYALRAMNGLRIAVTVLVVLVWGLLVPFAMAADHCAAMSSMCEGPCGASSTATPPDAPTYTVLVSGAPVASAPAVPQSEHPALEPPPKSPVRSA